MAIKLVHGSGTKDIADALRAKDPLKGAYDQGVQDGMRLAKFFRCAQHQQVSAQHAIGPEGPECAICVAQQFAHRVVMRMQDDILAVATAANDTIVDDGLRAAAGRLLLALGPVTKPS